MQSNYVLLMNNQAIGFDTLLEGLKGIQEAKYPCKLESGSSAIPVAEKWCERYYFPLRWWYNVHTDDFPELVDDEEFELLITLYETGVDPALR